MAIIDKFSDKMMFDTSLKQEILLRHDELQSWMDDNANYTDHPLLWLKFLEDPVLAMALIESSSLSNNEKVSYLIEQLSVGSKIALIVGIRGAGKTALAFFLIEEIHKIYPEKKICIIEGNYPYIPDYIEQVTTIFEAPEGSLVIFDEASITLNARDAMTKISKDISGLLAISRHQGLSIIFISQHSQMVDINLLRLADLFIFKRLSWEELYGKGEKTTDVFLKYVRLMSPKVNNEALFTDGEKWFKILTPLPTFWSDKVSKTYSKLDKQEAIAMAKDMYNKGIDLRIIVKQLKIRGIEWSEYDILYFIGEKSRKKKSLTRKKED